MKKFKVFETFSGIGAQHQALENLKNNNDIKFDYDVVGISDWDMYAVQSYAAMHHSDALSKASDPTEDDAFKFLLDNIDSLSADGKKPLNNISRIKSEFAINLYKSFKVSNNIGSVVDSFERVKENIINKKGKIDVLTYSFPCQDLSSAGNFHGFNEGIKKHTRSGLLYEIEKLIKNLKKWKLEDGKATKLTKDDNKEKDSLLPQFLLLENVVNLVQKQHKPDFDRWLDELSSMGYKTIWGIVNAHDFGLLQARRRTFALSIYDPENKLDWETPIRKDLSEVLNKIYKTNEFRPDWIQKHKQVFDFNPNKNKEEQALCQMKNTPSRVKMWNLGKKVDEKYDGKISTITTKQDRWPNAGNISNPDGYKLKDPSNKNEWLPVRFFTHRECYKLMGFRDDKFNKAHEVMNKYCVSKVSAREKLYKQAGNSIAVNALEMIFYYMSKLEEEVK